MLGERQAVNWNYHIIAPDVANGCRVIQIPIWLVHDAPRRYRSSVVDILCIRVPEDFADELTCAGFHEIGAERGVGPDFQPTLALVVTTLGVAANLATVVVARDSIAAFVKRLGRWMSGRTGPAPGSQLVIEVMVQSAGERSQLRLVCRREPGGEAELADARALASLLYALCGDDTAKNPSGTRSPGT